MEPLDLELATVSGRPGRVLRRQDGQVWDVLTIDVHDGQVHAVQIIRNPSKATHRRNCSAERSRAWGE